MIQPYSVILHSHYFNKKEKTYAVLSYGETNSSTVQSWTWLMQLNLEAENDRALLVLGEKIEHCLHLWCFYWSELNWMQVTDSNQLAYDTIGKV